ncbi:MAG: ABC transporter permease subunit [Rickettsiales bacterium]|nr:ABC transporter permease subunit [Rickettsiales bacterium]
MQFPSLPQRLIPSLNSTSIAVPGHAVRRLWFDAVAFLMVSAFLALISLGMTEMSEPIGTLAQEPISLHPSHLPDYALRTTLRMLIAVSIAVVFTLVYATLAAKSRKAGQILIPLLDILQSVPVLGYISFTIAGFMALFPGNTLGAEAAAIFAIFTSQAWNMTFSMYQSLQSMPKDMCEAAVVFRLSGWQKFWKMELPFAMPGLVWNMMVSMSGGWFFVVASEAITVGSQQISLPGIGSYIALAIAERDLSAIGYAIGTMTVVILLYDQLLFRPLIAWSDKFRYEMTARQYAPESWVLSLFSKSRLARKVFSPVKWLSHYVLRIRLFAPSLQGGAVSAKQSKMLDYAWVALMSAVGMVAGWRMLQFMMAYVTLSDLAEVMFLAMATLLRVVVLIVIASLVWVPLGVLIGLRPKVARVVQPLAQFLSAFPANLLFPVAVMGISAYQLNPNIWLSPLMILGTQWYILFNVIAGASTFPNDLKEAAQNLKIGGWLWWKKVMLPGVFPYYLTGALTASGGAWNASIVAEAVSWGSQSYTATGLGAYIAHMTQAGDIPHIVLGVSVMALTVVLFNKCVWRPLYLMAGKKLRLD